MLHAVAQELSKKGAVASIDPRQSVGFISEIMQVERAQRRPKGVYYVARFNSKKLPFADRAVYYSVAALPKYVRRRMHLVTRDEVEVVLDASGFAYSDQMPNSVSDVLASKYEQWKGEGKKIILLPQAFGPFEKPAVSRHTARIVKAADLVFARDQLSYQYLEELVGALPTLRCAPDFTGLVKGYCPSRYAWAEGRPCIVPNAKMVTKTSKGIREGYVSFLVASIDYLGESGVSPFILIHSTRNDSVHGGGTHSDLGIARRVQDQCSTGVRIICEDDPLAIKGIIGQSSFVLSSRFHGAVNALSQNVPALATGWSHKYEQLLEEYSCPECLVSPAASPEERQSKLDIMTDRAPHGDLVKRLDKANKYRRQANRDMWLQVHEVVDSI